MPPEPLTLVSPRRAVIHGHATWTRVPEWRRTARTAAIAAVGGLFGAIGLVVPPHGAVSLIVWAITGLAAYASWGRATFLDAVDFPCSCGAAVHLEGLGAWSPDLWVRCPTCAAPWRVDAPTDRPTGAPDTPLSAPPG